MNYNFKQLTHPGIQSLKPYVPGKSLTDLAKTLGEQEIIKLASNENVLGCSEKALAALHNLNQEDSSTYPTSISHPMRAELAKHLGIDTDMLTISNGSDLLIGLLITCFALHSDKHILTHDYAFVSYSIQAKVYGVPVVSTPTNNWEVDIDAMINACNEKTAIIFLANPNNPTGTLIKHQEIKRLIESIPKQTILVVDEAYYDYAKDAYEGSSIDLLQEHPNLVVMRTFSKAYGLAGYRIGYIASCPEISSLVYSIQLPFSVNIAAMSAASAALRDQDFIQRTIDMNFQGLRQLEEGLNGLGINYIPSHANFITVDCGKDGGIIANELEKDGIIVRPLAPYTMDNYVRITIGTQEQNARVLQSLAKIYS